MRRFALIFAAVGIAAAILAAVMYFAPPFADRAEKTIDINGTRVHVAIADTPMLRAQGLSGTEPLQPYEGMLFVFDKDGRYSFWMKDMRYAIDVIWIAMDGTVVYIAPSLSPETYPVTFTPPTPARYVLEVESGFATEHKITVGSKVRF